MISKKFKKVTEFIKEQNSDLPYKHTVDMFPYQFDEFKKAFKEEDFNIVTFKELGNEVVGCYMKNSKTFLWKWYLEDGELLTDIRPRVVFDIVRKGEIPEDLVLESFINEKQNKEDKEANKRKELWQDWKELVNMSASELESYLNSEDGKTSGMNKKDADKLGINNGKASARAIIKMKPRGGSFKAAEENWTPREWEWAKDQVSFIKRMNGMKKRMNPPYFYRNDKLTEWVKSLLIWGHKPAGFKFK